MPLKDRMLVDFDLGIAIFFPSDSSTVEVDEFMIFLFNSL